MSYPSPYLYLGQTTSLCETCLQLVPAKIEVHEGQVFFRKRCKDHGEQFTRVSTDSAFWRQARGFMKHGDLPFTRQTNIDRGCPYDCGLCSDHEQHSCLAVLEVTQDCDMDCPVCYADAGPKVGGHLDMATIERMLDALVESEGNPDVVQIGGGEPTRHPQILDILAAAKKRPIRHLMLDTNGLRLARDPDFVERLKDFMPGFEVYLQFDSLDGAALKTLRGADVGKQRKMALEALEKNAIPTTLVCTVRKGVNDTHIPAVVREALNWSCVRGVTFQAEQAAGRNRNYNPATRMHLSDLRNRVAEAGVFAASDILPLPCHPESIAVAYGLRDGQRVVPVTQAIEPERLLAAVPNTIAMEAQDGLRAAFLELFSLSSSGPATAERLGKFLCCLPKITAPEQLTYANVFRIALIEFMDRYNFDLGGIKRACIHVVRPDGRIMPFDTLNLFHRESSE